MSANITLHTEGGETVEFIKRRITPTDDRAPFDVFIFEVGDVTISIIPPCGTALALSLFGGKKSGGDVVGGIISSKSF